MQEYYSSDSVEAILRNNIQQIEILTKKRLFDLAKKIIAKAEKLATENYSYYYLGIVLSLKREIIISEESLVEISNYQSLYMDELKCIEMLKNNMDYNKLYMQVISVMNAQFWASDKKRAELKTILKNTLLKDETKAISLPAKLSYFTILGAVFFLFKELEKSYLNYKKVVQLLEQNPSYLSGRIEFYMVMMSRLFLTMVILKKDKELIFFHNKVKRFIESLPEKQQSRNIFKKYININNNHIAYHLQLFNFNKALKLSEQLKTNILAYNSTQEYLVFHINLFHIYFYLNDYHKALQQVNKILNSKESGIREDLIIASKILNIIVHYELGNMDMLPYLCKSTARYLEKKGQLNEAEKSVLNFFGKTILKADGKSEKVTAFIEFKKEYLSISDQTIYDNFDFVSWLESKIENRSFLDVVREKSGDVLNEE